MKLSADLRRRGWKKGVLRDYIALSNGKGITSRQMGPDKPIPVYGSSSIIGYTDKPLIFSDSIVIGRVGACGSLQIAKSPCWVSDNSMYVSQMRREVDFDFLFFLLSYLKPGRLASRTTQPSLPQGAILNQDFLLPPLPVQERIVEILQKADEIRQKCKQALELADKILPALFLEMFGDPATNPKGWPAVDFDSCLSNVTRECRKVQQHLYRDAKFGKYAVVDQGESFIGGYVNDESLLYKGPLPVIVFGDHTRRFKFINFPFVLGADGAKVLRAVPPFRAEYLYWHLQLSRLPDRGYERHFKFVRQLQFMVPPSTAQNHFAAICRALSEQRQCLEQSLSGADMTFQSLLARAFTGELTAEWEAANAEWIAAQQTLYERLPRLVILALLAEKARRARRSTEVLVTALMKYLFLVQMEGSSTRRRFYHFVPYHYGPFAKELYSDLQKLQDEGLVRVQSDPEEEKTKISLVDLSRVDEELAALPDDLKQDVASIIETYGDLDHTALLNTVYEKYPAYARKSRLKRKGRGSK